MGNYAAFFKEFNLEEEDMEDLYSLSREIINRYSIYFDNKPIDVAIRLIDDHFKNLIN
jgi:hypothetical protein